MSNKKYIIYKTTNLVNNKIYIGKHQTDNVDDGYLGSGQLLKRAVEKYGRDKFKKEVLFECDTLVEMNTLESEIVNEEFISRLDTYNLKLGGQGGWDEYNSDSEVQSLKSKKAWSKHKNNHPVIASGIEWRKNLSDEESLEYNSKISNGLKLYYNNNDNPFKDKKHTDKSKKMIGEKNSKHQMGDNNSQYGTMWITTGNESKKIKCDAIIPDGWTKGRKIKK